MCAESRRNAPLIIPIFIPHAGCPHRCAFCDQALLTHTTPGLPDAGAIAAQVRSYRSASGRRRHPVQLAFYGGNFLGLPKEAIRRLLAAALAPVRRGEVDTLRFSTRPDTIDEERLALLSGFPVREVELGAQSMDDRVLELSRRGHTAAHTRRAAALVKERGFSLGIQMMVGLPGDDALSTAATGRAIADLRPDFVRIYPAVVLEGSPLARWYREGRYTPPGLPECVERVAALRLLFESRGIRVIRTGLQSSADLAPGGAVVGGPYHPAFGHLVLSRIFLDMALAAGRELRVASGGWRGEILLRAHPRRVNALRGMGNENLRVLERAFGSPSVQVAADPALGQWDLALSDGTGRTILRRAVESPGPGASIAG